MILYMISSVFFHAFHVIVQKFPHAGTGIPICFLANSFMDHHGILCHASLHERRPALSSISKQTGQMAWRSGRPSFSPRHGAVFLFMECSAEYVKARPRHRSSFRHSCQGKFFPGTLPHGSGTLLPGQHPAFPETLCGNRHQCRTPRLLQPCPARGGNTDGGAFHRPEPFSGRFQLPNQIRIQHADKQKTGCLRPGYLPVAEKQDEDGKTGEIRKYGHRYRTE